MTALGWAILGAGSVAHAFAAGLRNVEGSTIVAVASRTAPRAHSLAARHGAVAMDYEAAVNSVGVDVVYIATPPALHEAQAMMAFAAGKAVLIEKPFAPDAPTARRIVAAARAAGVFCMEAMWTRFLPLAAELRARVTSGTLGQVRALEASFMSSNHPDPAASVFDPERGGGALAHRGVYGISLARWLLGPAQVVAAAATMGEMGVDEDCSIILRHDGGALSTIRASLRAPGNNALVISATKGMISVDPPLYRPLSARVTRVQPRRGGTGPTRVGRLDRWKATAAMQTLRRVWPSALTPGSGRILRPYRSNGYRHEAVEVANRLASGEVESPTMPLRESIEILALADDARKAWTGRES